MTSKVLSLWPVVLAAAVVGSGCDGGLPHDMGVRWQCFGAASRDGFFLGAFPPDDIAVCANPDVDPTDVVEACQGRCEDAYRAWGLFVTCDGVDPVTGGSADCHPSFTLDADCFVMVAGAGTEDCRPGSVIFQQGGPAQYEVGFQRDGVNRSEFTLDLRGQGASGGVSGRIEYTASPVTGPCPPAGCALQFSYIELFADDVSFDFGFPVGRKDVTGMVARNAGFIRGVLFEDGTFRIEPGRMQVVSNFDVSGDGHGSITLTNPEAFIGRIDRAAGTFAVTDARFSNGDASIGFTLRGTAVRSPPIADFDSPGQVECSADGTASIMLAAGSLEDAAYFWLLPDGTELHGPSVQAVLPLGTHRIELHVIDRFGGYATTSRSISVEDTLPPSMAAPTDIVVEACAASTLEVGDVTATDECDGSVATTAEIVDVNGNVVAEPLTSEFMFPLGETRIEYASVDSSGNVETSWQTVVLSEGISCCRAGLVPLVGTAGPDLLVSGNGGQCILGGGGSDQVDGRNGADQVFGGLGNDHILGSNGRDELDGGPGDDIIEGGLGDDVLIGASGRDELRGGHGDDVLRVRASCEVESGEVLDGGSGFDRLESPLSIEELTALGVVVISIEQFVLTPTQPGYCL